MKILKNIDPRIKRALKVTGFIALSVVVLAVLVSLMNGRTLSPDRGWFEGHIAVSPTRSNSDLYGGADVSSPAAPGMEMVTSVYDVSSDESVFGESVAVDAEEFEVTEYRATIRTQNLDRTCSVISDLKPLSYVIFESASKGVDSCHYSFKVEREHVGEVLAVIEDLDPRSLDQNTRTIKRQLDNYASERDILEEKIAAIDETLSSALSAYDEITRIASESSDASSLARVISSRVEVIERLTNERLQLAGQMERIVRAESEALERIDYTQFNVSISEMKYFDGERLSDSWRDALRNFFTNVNQALQGLTIGLVSFVFLALPFIAYAFIVLLALKYLIRLAKYIWRL